MAHKPPGDVVISGLSRCCTPPCLRVRWIALRILPAPTTIQTVATVNIGGCREPEDKMALSLGILPVVMAELLNKVQQVHQQSSQLTDELLLMPSQSNTAEVKDTKWWSNSADQAASLEKRLKFVFGPPILQALELVDQRSVTLVDSPSGRSLYQVVGSSGRVYRCFSSCLYCSCAAFMYSVLRRNDHILCKHLLAVYLCQAMGTLRQLRVSNHQLTDLLQAKDEELESTE